MAWSLTGIRTPPTTCCWLPWQTWQPNTVPPGRWKRVPVRRNTTLRDRPSLRPCSQGHEALGLNERRSSRLVSGRVSTDHLKSNFRWTQRTHHCMSKRQQHLWTPCRGNIPKVEQIVPAQLSQQLCHL